MFILTDFCVHLNELTFSFSVFKGKRKGKLGATKRVAPGAHLQTPWLFKLFEPANRPDDRADYCVDCSFLPSASTRYSFLHLSAVRRAFRANSVRARYSTDSRCFPTVSHWTDSRLRTDQYTCTYPAHERYIARVSVCRLVYARVHWPSVCVIKRLVNCAAGRPVCRPRASLVLGPSIYLRAGQLIRSC